MDAGVGTLSRRIPWPVLGVVALCMSMAASADAQEAPSEAAEGLEEDVPQTPDEAPSEVEEKPTVQHLLTAPGGVPLVDSDQTMESVRASMAKIQEQSQTGIDAAYVIDFGDTFDWVQLVSGEWIKGELKRMRDDSLEFDSDKLEMLIIDFADVAMVHSPRMHAYVFDDRESATGKAIIVQDTKVFPRGELDSIIEGGGREKDWWSMKLRFGLTLNRGNTDQLTYDVNFNTRREDDLTLLDMNYNANFGRTDGVQNVNRHLGELNFKVFVSKRWFLTPAFGQLFNDRFQNIRFRATPAAGAGVHIIDAPKVSWDFQTGVGYQFLRYKDDSLVTGANPQSDVFIPLFTYADFDITEDIELTLSWLTNLVVTTIGNTNHTGKADLAIELTSVLDLDVAFLFLRTEEPPPADPLIEKNDYQLVVGISLELG
jgi:putative salt-induced outer membrane protein YdiY